MNLIKETFQKNGFEVFLAENKTQAKEIVESILPLGATVAQGGSVSLSECGISETLRSGKYRFLDREEEGISKEEAERRMREVFFSDFYLASANAITKNGEIYNVDGRGNRVSAIMFGPRKVILVIGKNKIVEDINEAVKRVKTVAAPKNCRRLGVKSFCAEKGHCVALDGRLFDGCPIPTSICCDYTVIKKCREKGRISLILVNEDLGF